MPLLPLNTIPEAFTVMTVFVEPERSALRVDHVTPEIARFLLPLEKEATASKTVVS